MPDTWEHSQPFPHARGRLTVAEYARFEKPAENDLQRVYQDGHAHVDRLFALHYRLVGRILAHADAGERSLEKQPGSAIKAIPGGDCIAGAGQFSSRWMAGSH